MDLWNCINGRILGDGDDRVLDVVTYRMYEWGLAKSREFQIIDRAFQLEDLFEWLLRRLGSSLSCEVEYS